MKISLKLIVIFLIVSIIPVILVGFLSLNASQTYLKTEIENHLMTTTQARAHHIEELLESKKSHITIFSFDSFIKNNLIKLKDDSSTTIQIMSDLSKHLIADKLPADEDLREIFVLDANGKVIGTTNPEEAFGTDFSSDALFLEGKKGIYIKDVFYDEEFGENIFALSAPILDEKELLGIIVIKIALESLSEINIERMGLKGTGETYLVNKEGYMISPSRFIEDVILKQKVDTENARECFEDYEKFEAEGKIEEHKEEFMISEDYRGVRVLGAHAYIPEMRWCLLAEIDEKEVFAPVNRLRNTIILISIGIMAIVSVIIIFFSKTITKPITKLKNSVDKISKGNLAEPIEIKSKDEIGELAESFDNMRYSLKMVIDEYEKMKGKEELVKKLEKEIGERKKAEEELLLHSEMIKNMVEGAYIVSLDDVTIKYTNPKFEKMFGYKKGEMIGKHASIVNAPTVKDPKEVTRKIMKVIRETGEWNGEVNNIKKDGTPFWCYANVSVFDHPKYGKVLMAIHRDITKQKKAEEKLKKQKEKYEKEIKSLKKKLKNKNARP